MTVLVTGATGTVGSQVVHELRRRGVGARAFVRDRERAAALLGGDVDLVAGDFEDPQSVRRALAGVDRVLLSSADGPRKPEHEATVVDACAQTGVALVVKASTLGADPASRIPAFAWNGEAEERLRRSGVPAVILRSCFYMTNVLGLLDGDRLVAPAGQGRVAMIDPADVAAVAAAVLEAGDHAGETLALTGPEAIGFDRVAAALGATYVDPPPRAAREGLEAAGLPGWLVEQLDGVFALVRGGALADVTSTVAAVTGHEPRPFETFAREAARAARVPAAPKR